MPHGMMSFKRWNELTPTIEQVTVGVSTEQQVVQQELRAALQNQTGPSPSPATRYVSFLFSNL